jgi:hypothetical protein
MGLRRVYKKRFKGIVMKTGHIYTFNYQAFENDPKPTIVLMYAIEGIHAKTGHQWRLFQGINFSYVPRAIRKQFARDWVREFERTNGNPKFTWETVKRRYPQLMPATRRYFFSPNYYITKLQEVPIDKIESAIVSTWSKDFSKKVVSSLISKYRKIMGRRKGR